MAKDSNDHSDVVAGPPERSADSLSAALRAPDTSLVMLVAANLLPLAGVVFFGWDAGVLLVLYWAENLVVGFYNILKMALASGDHGWADPSKLFVIPFFLIHFGGFCAVHGVFVDVFASEFEAQDGMNNIFPDPDVWWGPLMFVGLLVGVIGGMWTKYAPQIFVPLVGLFVSHGVSFVQNYLLRGEYRKRTVQVQMALPYGRIVLMHVAILVSALPVILLGSPLPLLVIIIGMKIVIDAMLHIASHRRGKKGTGVFFAAAGG